MKVIKNITVSLFCAIFTLFCVGCSSIEFTASSPETESSLQTNSSIETNSSSETDSSTETDSTTKTGMRFVTGNNFEVKQALAQTPLSYEAEFKITSEELNSTQSYILGNCGNGPNHTGTTSALFLLKIEPNGCPSLYLHEIVMARCMFVPFATCTLSNVT